MKKSINSIFVLLTSCTFALAQAPAIDWEVNYGGTSSDKATSIRQTADGGYIVAGFTNSDNGDVVGHKSGDDFWVLKLNSTGTLEWKKIYGGNNDDRCYAVQQTSDGGFILAGTSNSADGDISSPKGGFDAYILKLDANGNKVFAKNFGGSDDEAAYSIVQTADGGYIAAGESKSDNIQGASNKGGYDVYVMRFTASGNLTFQKMYGGSATDRARGVDQLSGGEFIVAGESDSNNGNVSNNKGGFDYYVLRLKSNGAIRWTKTYGGTTNDNAYGIEATSNNGSAVIGETESNNVDVPNNSGGDDFWAISIKGSGDLRWSKTYGGETADNGRSIHRTSDGGFILCGETESSSGDVTGHHGADDYWVVKINSGGNLQWQKALGGFDADNGTSAAPTSDGGYIIAGESESDDGNVSDNNGNDDYWIVKLDGALKLSGNTTETIKLYPNPAANMVTLEGLSEGAIVTVYSLTGSLVDRREAIANPVTIDVAAWQSGYYLVRINNADGSTETLKLYKSE